MQDDHLVITDAFNQSIRKMHSIRSSLSSILSDGAMKASDLCIVYLGQEEKLGATCSLQQAKAVVLIGDESWSFFSEKIAEISANLHHLYLTQMNFSPEFSADFLQHSTLYHLTFENCYFQQISDSIAYLTVLNGLKIVGCQQLNDLPDTLSQLSNLQHLHLEYCEGFSQLPHSVAGLRGLSCLHLKYLHALITLGEFGYGELRQDKLQHLKVLEIVGCRKLHVSSSQFLGFTQLQTLHLIACPEIAHIQVREAYAQPCKVLVEQCLPCVIQVQPVAERIKTQIIYQQQGCYQDVLLWIVSFLQAHCQHVQIHLQLEINALKQRVRSIDPILFELGFLQQLRLVDFHHLATLPDQIEKFADLAVFEMIKSHQLQQLPHSIGRLQQLRKLRLIRLNAIQDLPVEIGHLTQLEILDVSGCRQLRSLPDSIGQLKKLKMLRLAGCHAFQYLPKAVETLTELECLHLSGCVKLQNLPDLSSLKNLKILHLSGCSFQTLPDSIKDLVGLEILHLSGCRSLEALPMFLGELINLKTIYISGCLNLKNRAIFYAKYSKIRLIFRSKYSC